MELTQVEAEVEGDAWFPDWDPEAWRETTRSFRASDAQNCYDLTFVRLERVRSVGSD